MYEKGVNVVKDYALAARFGMNIFLHNLSAFSGILSLQQSREIRLPKPHSVICMTVVTESLKTLFKLPSILQVPLLLLIPLGFISWQRTKIIR